MKSTSRDIWAIPPGGFESKPVRRWIRPTIAASLVLLLGIGGGALYSSMKRSTAVSTDDAIAEFRAEAQSDPGDQQGSDAKAKSTGRPNKTRAGGSKDRAISDKGRVQAAAAGASTDDGSAPARNTSSGGSQKAQRNKAAAAAIVVRPEDGVYTWNVDGVERAPGVERRMPRRSSRVVTYEGSGWVEHHIFSEQKELWFHLETTDQGTQLSAARNRVVMGPVEVDKTVTFDPAVFVSHYPFELNQTWQGSWDGKTRGSYSGRTIDHGTLVIGGEKVEVWVTEVRMEMRGDVEGNVLTRSWVAPDYGMVVKQYQETNVKSGPGDYYSEWEGQLVSLKPQK